ncbi:hypothetical protein DL766_007845 [Monosporascus sp. MC13-8B]|uniref:Major facilitator superfamily (MFS) profile domain-containing protein n=1 Tax=Monosporascus cannonballus TaxID=155416 RepID=A0ABY0HCR6_9PEZI|nr:hypothetical protein DL763_006726 [Monosporascus cannonballus]RYO87358.1 hypothetical protein DL762_004288 [Monosporascus cannonballus]RYP21862.1 hypothetical protein DL766_007845 [Monosporascus sp. MC13-8B]
MSNSNTQVVEAQPVPLTELPHHQSANDVETAPGDAPSGPDVVGREPATPFLKLVVAGYSFFCAGVGMRSLPVSVSNDGTLGPLLPYMLSYWGISAGQVAIIYATTFAGWFVAAVTNPILAAHLTLGQLLSIVAYQDSHSNTFVSGLHNVPHRWLSFIHACCALGCFVGPMVATAIANSPNSMGIAGWKRAYIVLVAISLVNQVGVARNRAAFRETAGVLRLKTLWIISMFYFFNLGAVMTAGGWVVEFLTTVRGGNLANMGYVPTGYYGGLLAGRLFLAEPTYRFGERRMLIIYSVVCACLQLVFWLQPNIIGSAVALSLMGFFFGPFFATGMSVASKIFPRELQTTALGYIFVLAQAGGSLFPSITGLIATGAGVAVLQPIVLALIVATGLCWWLIPRSQARNE